MPITKGAIYSPVQVTNITEKPKTTITLEEDILVPDTKPDLREILMIDGKSHLAVKEIDAVVKGDDYINLSGEIELQTLYLPEKQEGNLPVISVQTRAVSYTHLLLRDKSVPSVKQVIRTGAIGPNSKTPVQLVFLLP